MRERGATRERKGGKGGEKGGLYGGEGGNDEGRSDGNMNEANASKEEAVTVAVTGTVTVVAGEAGKEGKERKEGTVEAVGEVVIMVPVVMLVMLVCVKMESVAAVVGVVGKGVGEEPVATVKAAGETTGEMGLVVCCTNAPQPFALFFRMRSARYPCIVTGTTEVTR